MHTEPSRQEKGHLIAHSSGAIKRINRGYKVLSQSGNGSYVVVSTPLGWVCSCPDHKFRGVKCKHIFAVEISFALRKQVEIARIEPIPYINNCIYCKSNLIVRTDYAITNTVIFRNLIVESAVNTSQLT